MNETECVICRKPASDPPLMVKVDDEVVTTIRVCVDHRDITGDSIRNGVDLSNEQSSLSWALWLVRMIHRTQGINPIERALYTLVGTYSSDREDEIRKATDTVNTWTVDWMRENAHDILQVILK